MSSYFRAIAADFDGTLTDDGPPDEAVLRSLDAARDLGMKLLLVTGRVVTELLHVFPDAERWFDVIVAENGAVIRRDGVSHALTAPVPLGLDAPLVERGVHFQRGQVLLACHADDELAVLEEIRRLEADCQLIRNRQALMVLPSGISKGSGLLEALEGLGISHHSTIGIGDAENDLALLRQCELGVAVGNAVQSLKHEADLVLSERAGHAVVSFVRDHVLAGRPLPTSRRWQVNLGRSKAGHSVRLPGSQINVMVMGGSGVGKSYAAGLLAERLIEQDYSVCILDPEGDHAPLGRLGKVLIVGGRGLMPPADQIARLLGQPLGSLVVDLSLESTEVRTAHMRELLRALAEERTRSGLPHWIVIDEAHLPCTRQDTCGYDVFPGQKGLCLVTYAPDGLAGMSGLEFDYLLAIPGEAGIDPTVLECLRSRLGVAPDLSLPTPTVGQALLADVTDEPKLEVLTLGRRFVEHVRHWHKYATSHLPPGRAFEFRTIRGPTGARADNLATFRRELLICTPGVLQHHAAHRDFSAWLEETIHDRDLARIARKLEERIEDDGAVEDLRHGLVEAVEDRYLA